MMELKAIEARANAATPIGERCPEKLYLFANDSDLIAQIRSYHAGNSDNDYEFYYHARTDIPALIAELRAAREALREIVRGPTLTLQTIEPYTPLRVAELTARYSQQIARKALGEE